MNIEHVIWELGILLQARKEYRLIGRDTDYQEDGRIKELRAFLDTQETPPPTTTETKTSDEIAF